MGASQNFDSALRGHVSYHEWLLGASDFRDARTDGLDTVVEPREDSLCTVKIVRKRSSGVKAREFLQTMNIDTDRTLTDLDVAPLLHRDQAQVVPLVQPANGRQVSDTPQLAIRISLDI